MALKKLLHFALMLQFALLVTFFASVQGSVVISRQFSMRLVKLLTPVNTSFRPCPCLSCLLLLVLGLEYGQEIIKVLTFIISWYGIRPPPDEPRRNPKRGPFFPRVLKITVFPSVRIPIERESRLEQETLIDFTNILNLFRKVIAKKKCCNLCTL